MVNRVAEDRRQAVRAKRILSIQYRLVESKHRKPEKDWHLSTTQDMSVLGLSFLSDAAYAIGDCIELKVIMSGVLDIYNGLAKVVRAERKKGAAYYLMGVKFVSDKAKPRTRKAKAYTAGTRNRLYKVSKK
ncbi:MAG: hypothetical protein A2Z88_01120 [Omnitrophica WOR_2 bacterium GWA2_47_8]|nr:MAG: hypothetical protein A2Z88_01120 [Omnitrophica WOR_2 bacterium GWA2_47_8]